MKIKGRKVIVWVLAAVMIFSLIPASVFADVVKGNESDAGVSIVVFGNSSSSGFGMPDSWSSKRGFSLRNNDLNSYLISDAKNINEGRISTDSFPWRLKKYIAENEFDGDMTKVNLTSLALNGMRVDEALALLNEDFYNTATAREAAYKKKWDDTHTSTAGDGFLTTRVWNCYNAFYECGASQARTYKAGNAFVKSAVKDADVIVMDACNNSFGTYIGYRAAAYLGLGFTDALPNTYETINDISGVPESVKKSIMAVEDKLEEAGVLNNGFTKQIVDAYIFATASTIVNYTAAIENLRELNPDAKIITVSIANVNKGMRIKIGDTVVDIGDYLGELFEIVNLYIRTMYKNADNVYFADIHGSVSTFGESIASKDTLDEVFADGPEDGLVRDDKGEVVTDEYGNPYMETRANYGLHQLYQREDGKYGYQGFNYDYLGGMFSTDPETGGETFYNDVLSSMLQSQVTLKSWDEMKDDEIVTGTLTGEEGPTLYMAFDFNETDLEDMVKFDSDGNLYPVGKIDENNTTVYITKANIDKVVRRIYQLLLDGTHHNTIDVNAVTSMVSDSNAMSKAFMQFIFGAVDEAPDATLGLLYLLIRFVMCSAIAEHPSKDGCSEKYEAVLGAYLSDTPAREQAIEEIRERIKEICQEIKDIADSIEEAAKKDIEKLITDLMPLINELKEMGVAIYELPEYEDLIDSYADSISLMEETTFILKDRIAALEIDSADIQNKVDAFESAVQELEQQAQLDDFTMMKLKAKSVRVHLDTSVTFPSEKVKVTISWDGDEDADGYVLKVNGAVKEPTATATGFTYVDEAAQVGKKYSFEVRPYVLYKGEQIGGDIFKTSVVPEVKLKKGVIKSLTKGTQSFTVKWKKVSGASGYKVSYKLDKKTTKKTVNGGNKLSLKVKGLESGKKYTVKVRAWKKVNGKKYYGKWYKAKKVKVD